MDLKNSVIKRLWCIVKLDLFKPLDKYGKGLRCLNT